MKVLLCLIASILLIDCLLQASNAEKYNIKFQKADSYAVRWLLFKKIMPRESYDAIINDEDLHHTILNKVDQIECIICNMDQSKRFKKAQEEGCKNRMQESFYILNTLEASEYKKKRDYGYDQNQSTLALNPILSSKKGLLQTILNSSGRSSSSHCK